MRKKTKKEIEEIWNRHLKGLSTEDEKALLESWHIQHLKSIENSLSEEQAYQAIKRFNQSDVSSTRKITNWQKAGVAASIILLLGLSFFYFNVLDRKDQKQHHFFTKKNNLPIAPGSDKAQLKLADGKVINLDEQSFGKIAESEEFTIISTKQGVIDYNQLLPKKLAKEYNKISIPRGGKYQVNLPDGTKVWLNASSTLRFPPCFDRTKRTVKLKGEAYFEVAKSNDEHGNFIPFFVETEQQEIKVLGTHFNINAYPDESATKTTLLAGKVLIKSTNTQNYILLHPGQQARSINNFQIPEINEVDLNDVIAWKNGLFSFENISLEELMRQIARWYNVEVTYAGPIMKHAYIGKIERSASIDDVLNILKLSGLQVSIHNRKVTITESNPIINTP